MQTVQTKPVDDWTSHVKNNAAHWDHLVRIARDHGGKKVCEACGIDKTSMSLILHGRRPISPKFWERVSSQFPPPPDPEPKAKRHGESLQNPHTVWINKSEAQRIELITQAEDARDQLDAVDRLVLCPLYQALRSRVIDLAGSTIAELPEYLLLPPTDGPAVAMAEAIAQVNALIEESKVHQAAVDPNVSSELWKRFSSFREASRRKLDKLQATADPEDLVKGEAWRATVGALSGLFRPHTDLRQLVVEVLRTGNVLERDLAAHLDRIRAITFPSEQFRNDPVGFAYYILGTILWDGQVELAESFRDHKDTTAATGQKIGKTVLVAVLCLWWYCVWSDGYAIITNATGKQLERQDWMWVKRLFRQSGICFDCKLAGVTKRPCPHSQVIDGILLESSSGGLRSEDDQRWIIGTTAKIPDDVGGYSGEHLGVLIDEASKLVDDIFEAWMGNTGAEGAKLFLLGNPLGQSGPFRRVNTAPSEEKHWSRHKISSVRAAQWNATAKHKIPGLMSMDRIERIKESDEMGDKSPAYMVRILGEYPTIDESCIYPIDLVLGAQDPDVYEDTAAEGKLVVSIDPAGEELRGDAVLFCARRGLKVHEFKSFKGLRLDDYLEYALDLIRRFRGSDNEIPLLAIDADGVGSRVVVRFQNYQDTRRVEEHNKVRFELLPVYFGHEAIDWEAYDLSGDEAHAITARWLRRGGVFPDCAKLQQEMQHAQWFPVRRNRHDRQIEVLSATRKDGPNGWRKIIGRSPDHLDSLRIGLLAEERLGYSHIANDRSANEIEDEENQNTPPLIDEREAYRQTIRKLRTGRFGH